MMKRFTTLALLSILLSMTAYAQSDGNAQVNLSKTYWLNYSLIFLEGCQPRVLPDNIIFTEGTCRQNVHYGEIFLRGAKVKIYSVIRERGLARVRFRHWPEVYELESEYEILLKSDSDESFRKSFGLLFADRGVPGVGSTSCPVELKTKEEVIKCLGFPISVSKVGGVERYEYRLEFVGFSYQSYDAWTIEIKGNKVVGVYGII